MSPTNDATVASASTEITWHARSPVALVRYSPSTQLESRDGGFLVDALTAWIGADDQPLGTGIPWKSFADEPAARSWLRTKGVLA